MTGFEPATGGIEARCSIRTELQGRIHGSGGGGVAGVVVQVDGDADHTVGEIAGTGTDLNNYATSIACVDRAGVKPRRIPREMVAALRAGE